jgi:hypothetical protein
VVAVSYISFWCRPGVAKLKPGSCTEVEFGILAYKILKMDYHLVKYPSRYLNTLS